MNWIALVDMSNLSRIQEPPDDGNAYYLQVKKDEAGGLFYKWTSEYVHNNKLKRIIQLEQANTELRKQLKVQKERVDRIMSNIQINVTF